MHQWQRWQWPIILFASTLGIRMAGLGSEALWYDESFSAALGRLPLPQMIQATAGDVHPPLWYLVVWLVSHLGGTSEFWLRVPAALFSAGAVTELYLLVRNMVDHRTGLWSAGLMAFSAGMQYYGQEGRQYSLFTFLIMMCLRSALEDKRWRFAPTLALSLYTHNLAALYAVPLAGIALWKWRKDALLPLAIAGWSYAPWFAVLVRQLGDLSQGYWIAEGGIGGTIYYWIYGSFGTRVPGWATIHTSLTAIVMTIGSLWAIRRDLKKYAPLLAVAGIPALELFTVSTVWQPMMLARGLLPSSAGVLGLWGLGLSKMNKQARTFALVILVPMIALSMVNYFTDPTVKRAPADPQIEIIESNWQSGDVIYHTTIATPIGYSYYLPEYDFAIMPGGNERGGLTRTTRDALGLSEHEMPVETLTGQGYRRAFVVWATGTSISDQQIAEASAIMDAYPVLKTWPIADTRFGDMTIYLVDLRGGYGMAR